MTPICNRACGIDCTMGGYECQIPMPINGRVRGIDRCIAPIVAALNAANITTIASCGGHGDLTRRCIILEDGTAIRFSPPQPEDRPLAATPTTKETT